MASTAKSSNLRLASTPFTQSPIFKLQPPMTTHRPFSKSRVHSQLVRTKPRTQQSTYTPTPFDNLLLQLFRRKMVQEVGWDSPKPDYDGLMEVVKHLFLKSKDKMEAEASSVRILVSLFPPFLLPLFRALIAPLFGGKPASVLTARVTQITCQWLMGPCSVNTVDLADGSTLESGVLIERCKYLEESKCAGVCIHTCKIPTQRFISEYMAVPLTLEPNFEDFSCQFKFGVKAPARDDDESMKTACLDVCPVALTRTKLSGSANCPQIQE